MLAKTYCSRLKKRAGLRHAIERFEDNIMWETDFPHPTSQSPTLKDGWSRHPRDYAEAELKCLNEVQIAKVLHQNAARFFNLEQ